MQPHSGRERDDDRYRHPPPASGSSNGHHRSSYPYPYQLPPPIPSAHSPMGMVPSYAPSPSRGTTDPQGWASQQPPADRIDRPGSRSQRGSWAAPSPRDSSSNRLPSLALPPDFPHRSNPPTPWDAPSPSPYAFGNGRSASFGGPVYRDTSSKPPPATPASSNGSFSYGSYGHPIEDHPSPKHVSSRKGSSQLPPRSPPPTSSTGKHPPPSQEGAEGDSSGQKKKKRRVALSCAECAKRKQKCNRETPCQHCVGRRVPELCVPYTRPTTPPEKPGKGDKKDAKIKFEANTSAEKPKPSMLPTISVRVARLEAIVNAVVNRVPAVGGTKALKDWRINHAPAESPPPLGAEDDDEEEEEEEEEAQEDDDKTREYERPTTTSSSVRSRRDDNSAEFGDGEGEDGVDVLDRATSGRNPLPQSMMHSSQPVSRGLDYHGTAAERLQKLFEDCGVSPSKVTSLFKDLPKRTLANRLVDWFFEKFNYVRYPIDDHSFRQALETVYADKSSPAAVLALPLVFIVLAISSRIAPEAMIETEEKKKSMSLKMYWSSKSAVIFASAVKAENIQLVETRICSGLYLVLMHDRRLAEGWADFRMALTVGQAIGLHRDGKKLGLDPYVTEYRRRLWSYLIHADATYSCLLGRPVSIEPSCMDTLPPSNIGLPDLLHNKEAKPKPWAEPTFGTYLILRRGLGEIVAKITHHFQRLEGPTEYRDVELIDADLKQFVSDLPPAFSMTKPDKSHDDKMWFVPIHRYYIQTEILHFTIILHRPWLLRRLKSSRYNLSRAACTDAAITDYRLRQEFKVDCPDFFETLLGSSFREFNAAMIAGISLLINYRAAHANDMRQIVQSFMEQHPHNPKADDFSQKEASIIHTLHQRAQEMEEKRAARRYQHRVSHENPSFNTSFERGSPQITGSSMAAPPMPSMASQDQRPVDPGSDVMRPVPLPSPSGSAQAIFRGSPYGLGAAQSSTTSPDDDHPQELLDQWILNNTSFGPGADSTGSQINLGLYSMQVPPMASIGPAGGAQQQSQIPPQPAGQDLSAGGGGGMGQTYPAMEMATWMDPSLMPGGVFAPMQTPATDETMRGGGMGGAGSSSMQYWNTLIDGIVTTLPHYDSNYPPVGQ